MLTIKEAENKEAAQQFLNRQGCLIELGDEIVMTCKDGDEVLGVAALSLSDGCVKLNLICVIDGDVSLSLGLAKSILNLADLRGIKEVYGTNPELASFYKMLRFTEQEGEYFLSLDGYFTAEKH